MRRPVRALVAPACLPVLLGALVSCGDDGASASTDPVEVEVGKAFEWNGFAVDEGWTLTGVKRSAGAEEVTTPDVRGTITNEVDDERAALFQIVFSSDGDPVATVNCSAAKMQRDQSEPFECPGLGATMPADYDAVVVQEFVR